MFALSVIAFVVALCWHGVQPSWTWFGLVGLPSSVVTAAVAYFVADAWRWKIFYGWFVSRPDLNGEWTVTIESNFGSDGEQALQVNGKMRIVQTYNRILIYFQAPQSSGEPVSAVLEVDEAKNVRLVGIYRNNVEFKAREKMRGHHGAYILNVDAGRRPVAMSGEYWNDRGNAGTMTVVRV